VTLHFSIIRTKEDIQFFSVLLWYVNMQYVGEVFTWEFQSCA